MLFEIETIKEEVFFYEFYLLQLLKLEFPRVYEALINNRYLFFTLKSDNETYEYKTANEAWESEDSLSRRRMFQLDPNNQADPDEGDIVTSFKKYLQDNQEDLDLTEYDKNLITHLVDTLLKVRKINKQGEDVDLYKSFAYRVNFHKYFAFSLYEGDISAKEFEEFRRKDFETYKQKIFEWIDMNKYSALIDRLDKVHEFSSILEFENHINILFEIGRYQVKEDT